MNGFADLPSEIVRNLSFALQGFLLLFFVISPFLGKLIHQRIAKSSSLVLTVCTMILIGNLVYMGMVYWLYPRLPEDAIGEVTWIVISFCLALSSSLLIGRYLNWFLSDNMSPTSWEQEYEDLTEDDMMPFDRQRKQEMERRKRARHE